MREFWLSLLSTFFCSKRSLAASLNNLFILRFCLMDLITLIMTGLAIIPSIIPKNISNKDYAILIVWMLLLCYSDRPLGAFSFYCLFIITWRRGRWRLTEYVSRFDDTMSHVTGRFTFVLILKSSTKYHSLSYILNFFSKSPNPVNCNIVHSICYVEYFIISIKIHLTGLSNVQ